MRAMFLESICDLSRSREPLVPGDAPEPVPGAREILVKVSACGVCHTELDEIEGRTPPSFFPVIPGHEIVGRVVETGSGATRHRVGDRVGIAWINSSCGVCGFCREGKENLCDQFKATGRDAHGGYAEYATVHEDYAFPIPEVFSDIQAAPLLCAGAVGYRSLRLTGMKDGDVLGLVGFGASAHLVIQAARHACPGSEVYVFARSPAERDFARHLGAAWAGDFDDKPPTMVNVAIDTTPAWRPIVEVMKRLEKGGRLVINAIRKEEVDKEALLALSYPDCLWLEKEIKSVANVAKDDAREFLQLAASIPIKPEVEEYGLEDANEALLQLKERKIRGAKVLVIA